MSRFTNLRFLSSFVIAAVGAIGLLFTANEPAGPSDLPWFFVPLMCIALAFGLVQMIRAFRTRRDNEDERQ